MKSISGWNDYRGKSGNGTNSSGFNGLPGGYRDDYYKFVNQGNFGYWWSAPKADIAFGQGLFLNDDGLLLLYAFNLNKGLGFSVRCVKD
jgi:uncharacterized protein (TIGR02145 family)